MAKNIIEDPIEEWSRKVEGAFIATSLALSDTKLDYETSKFVLSQAESKFIETFVHLLDIETKKITESLYASEQFQDKQNGKLKQFNPHAQMIMNDFIRTTSDFKGATKNYLYQKNARTLTEPTLREIWSFLESMKHHISIINKVLAGKIDATPHKQTGVSHR